MVKGSNRYFSCLWNSMFQSNRSIQTIWIFLSNCHAMQVCLNDWWSGVRHEKRPKSRAQLEKFNSYIFNNRYDSEKKIAYNRYVKIEAPAGTQPALNFIRYFSSNILSKFLARMLINCKRRKEIKFSCERLQAGA